MKRFLNICLGVCLTICITNVHGQSVIVKGGFNLSSIMYKDDGKKIGGYKMNPSMHIGATVDVPLASQFSLETGLLLSVKGSKLVIGMEPGNVKMTKKTDLLYLNLPLNARTTFKIANLQMFATTGPYVGYGIVGRNKFSSGQVSKKSKEDWGTDGLKRLDYGVGIGTGVEFRSIILGINYDFGLANIGSSHVVNAETSMKNRVFSLSAGYRFGSK